MLALLDDSRIQRASDLLQTKKRSIWKSTVLSPEEQIPRGALTEWVGQKGSGKTSRLLTFFAEQLKEPGSRPIAWVGTKLEVFPTSLPQFGISPEKILFLEGESRENTLWSAHQCLRSGLFHFIVLDCPFSLSPQERQIELRRLQVDSERNFSSLILLRETPISGGAWAIQNRIWKKQARLTQNLRIR